MPAALAEQIRRQQVPVFEEPADRLIWLFAHELYCDKRVSDATYAACCQQFGLPVVVNLVGLLGYYALVAMTLNVFDMRAEGQTELPFVEAPSARTP